MYLQAIRWRWNIVNDNAAVLVDIPGTKDVTRGVMYKRAILVILKAWQSQSLRYQ